MPNLSYGPRLLPAIATFSSRAATILVPLLAFAVTWSAFPTLLTWRHSQLIGGAMGGLVLLLLRGVARTPDSQAAGRTPLAIAMTALVGAVALALPIAHPEIWSAASVALCLTGVTVWLWYPPAGFQPFRVAVHALLAMTAALLVPLLLDALTLSPWRTTQSLSDASRPLAGIFDRSDTLPTALLAVGMGLLVASTTRYAASTRWAAWLKALIAATIGAQLLVAQPLPLMGVGLLAATATGALILHAANAWRAQRRGAAPKPSASTPVRPRSMMLLLAALLLASVLPPVIQRANPSLFASGASDTLASSVLDPAWRVADPLPVGLQMELARAEWRAAAANLPFGAGVGTWLDDTLAHLSPQPPMRPDEEPTRQADWPDQPRSTLAAAISEHGVIAAFVWVLIALGGVLLARLILRNTAASWPLVATSASLPAIAFLAFPGATHPAIVLTALLTWFLTCDPLAALEGDHRSRLVPSAVDPGDRRRPPRGRIAIILIPALVVGWFSIGHLRWSRHAALAYDAAASGDASTALRRFEAANRAMPHPATLYNEAALTALLGNRAIDHAQMRLQEALRRSPHSPSYGFMSGSLFLRWHQLAMAEPPNAETEAQMLDYARVELKMAVERAPNWARARLAYIETLLLLGERDATAAAIDDARALLWSAPNRTELLVLEARLHAWLNNDPDTAIDIIDKAESAPAYPATRYMLQGERARLETWKRSGENSYGRTTLHEGHDH